MKSIKTSLLLSGWLLGLLLFGLGYYEDIQFGGLKIGVLWKAVILAALIVVILTNRYIKPNKLFIIGIFIFLKSLIYVYTDFKSWLVDFSEAMKFLVLPLSILLFSTTKNEKFVYRLILFLCYWIPLSCVPFFFGLNPNIEITSSGLDIYGIDDKNAFIGIFSNSHVAGVTLASHLLLLIHVNRFRLLGFTTILLLGTISLWALYTTYARTGWASLIVGAFFYTLFFWSGKKIIVRYSIILPLAFIVGVTAFISSDIFRMRITGTNLYVQEVDSNQLGSGRLLFWSAALEGPLTEGIPGLLLGVGIEQTKNHMENSTGLRIVSHNGFLDAYQNSGLIGLSILVFYLFKLWKWLWIRRSINGWIPLTFLSQLILIQTVQGGNFWWFYIMMSSTFFWIGKNEKYALRASQT